MKEFEVRIHYSRTHVELIKADNEEEAFEIARDIAVMEQEGCDEDIDSIEVQEQ